MGHTGLLDWSAKAACLSNEFVRFFCKPYTLSLTPLDTGRQRKGSIYLVDLSARAVISTAHGAK
jgi:hypothetical protein